MKLTLMRRRFSRNGGSENNNETEIHEDDDDDDVEVCQPQHPQPTAFHYYHEPSPTLPAALSITTIAAAAVSHQNHIILPRLLRRNLAAAVLTTTRSFTTSLYTSRRRLCFVLVLIFMGLQFCCLRQHQQEEENGRFRFQSWDQQSMLWRKRAKNYENARVLKKKDLNESVASIMMIGNDPESFRIPERKPTHRACTGSYTQGIFHIAQGDPEGGVGTALFQLILAQLRYAERNHLTPWVHLDHKTPVVYDQQVHAAAAGQGGVSLTAMVGPKASYERRSFGYVRELFPGPPDLTVPVEHRTLHFSGTGIWEHYFEPVSDFVPGDVSCESKLYVTMDQYLVNPGLHGYDDEAISAWRYEYLLDYVTKPHLPLQQWLEPHRKRAHETIQKYIRFRSYLTDAAKTINPGCSFENACLGLHIRHSDKAHGRKRIETAAFLPYVEHFVRQGGRRIYVATDSSSVMDEIQTTWPREIAHKIRSAAVVRSSDKTAVFNMASHHRTNQEALVEMLALSMCQFMVHGYSALSESAVWINLDLHYRSVNLEAREHLDPERFGKLVRLSLEKRPVRELPVPVSVHEWWNEATEEWTLESRRQQPTDRACEDYEGILAITSVGSTTSVVKGFFSSIVNQLIYAEMHNLKPWIHLNATSERIYDPKVHGAGGTNVSFTMMRGMEVPRLRHMIHLGGIIMSGFTMEHDTVDLAREFPGTPVKRSWLYRHRFEFEGNGVWETYFSPVSDFVPRDESCRDKPLIQLDPDVFSQGCPWCVEATRKPGGAHDQYYHLSEQDWYREMRRKASQVVAKYFHFQPYIIHKAKEINPAADTEACLGLHIGNSNSLNAWGKSSSFWTGRKHIQVQDAIPYVEAYLRAGGRCIFLATDSHDVYEEFYSHLSAMNSNSNNNNNSNNITTSKVVYTQGPFVVRTKKSKRNSIFELRRSLRDRPFREWPSHLEHILQAPGTWGTDRLEEHHRVNSETLVDILALSKCRLLLHGYSTVSEAAIYLNPTLHDASVNLESSKKLTVADFERITRTLLRERHS